MKLGCSKTEFALSAVLIVVAAYLSFANVRYRFKYPKKTETELFLDFPKWIVWRD